MSAHAGDSDYGDPSAETAVEAAALSSSSPLCSLSSFARSLVGTSLGGVSGALLSVSGQVGSEVDVVEGSAEPLFPQPGRERAKGARTEIPPRRSNNSVERGRKRKKRRRKKNKGPRGGTERPSIYKFIADGEGRGREREREREVHRKSSFPKLSNSSSQVGFGEEGEGERN